MNDAMPITPSAVVPPRDVELADTTLTGWTTPTYDELKMDAEIGSYQQDDEREWT